MKKDSIAFIDNIILDDISTENIFNNLEFSSTGTKRICLHENDLSSLHVMLIEISTNTSYPPHSHKDGDEYFFLIYGEIDLLIWLNGKESDPIKFNINSYNSINKIVKIPKNTIHMTIPKTKSRYLEIKPGPFDKSNMIFHKITNLSNFL